jgi:hypothetical protein
MIQIPRLLVRQARAVFRRLVRKPLIGVPAISFVAGKDGLRIRLRHDGIQAELHQPGNFSNETITLPFDSLADFEGRKGDVTLDAGNGAVQVRWDDNYVPRVMDFESPDLTKYPSFPAAPTNLASADPSLLKALADASDSTARDALRYATDKVQLRGKTGEIIATDGRQLLIQTGFTFPFTEDLLIPSLPMLGCRELPTDSVAVAKHGQVFVLRTGPWAPIDKDGRFPSVDSIIPKATAIKARCSFSATDAAFLDRTLSRLPGEDDENAPVTVDLSGQVRIRARSEGQAKATELVLAESAATGRQVSVCLNREFLSRAVQMGLSELCVVDSDSPLLFQDAQRKFVIMPLPKTGCIAPSEDAIRIHSTNNGRHVPDPPATERSRPTKPKAAPHDAESGNGQDDLSLLQETKRSQEAEVASGNQAQSGSGSGVLLPEMIAFLAV